MADKSISHIFDGAKSFSNAKRDGVGRETIFATKDFLDAELARFETWKLADKNISQLFSDPEHYSRTRREGVGRETIQRFLGEKFTVNPLSGIICKQIYKK